MSAQEQEWMDYVDRRGLVQLPESHRSARQSAALLVGAGRSPGWRWAIGRGMPIRAALGVDGGPGACRSGEHAGEQILRGAALSFLGAWTEVEGRILAAENVRMALLFVARGEGGASASSMRPTPRQHQEGADRGQVPAGCASADRVSGRADARCAPRLRLRSSSTCPVPQPRARFEAAGFSDPARAQGRRDRAVRRSAPRRWSLTSCCAARAASGTRLRRIGPLAVSSGNFSRSRAISAGGLQPEKRVDAASPAPMWSRVPLRASTPDVSAASSRRILVARFAIERERLGCGRGVRDGIDTLPSGKSGKLIRKSVGYSSARGIAAVAVAGAGIEQRIAAEQRGPVTMREQADMRTGVWPGVSSIRLYMSGPHG